MRPRTLVLLLVAVFAALAVLAFGLNRGGGPATSDIDLAEAMRADTTGYALALAPQPFVFPRDHGPHPDFRTEWWYYTGNLRAADGRPYGFELTFFRIAVAPPNPATDADTSAWRSRQLYMAHFGLTDSTAQKFYAFERFGRGAAGLAGADAAPFRVWIDDWQVEQGPGGMPQMRVAVAQDGVGIALDLRAEKPMVLQGDAGYSRKGAGVGNASFYYTYTRLGASGTVTTPAGTATVAGSAWMDREWSTSALDSSQVGWDWFALQLDDGRDVMAFHLRDATGAPTYGTATVVAPDGEAEKLTMADFDLAVTRRWTSPHSGAAYPAGWTLKLPGHDLDLRVTPVIDDQELNVSVRYWEGAVRVEGSGGLRGVGYVEMTGYDAGAGTTRGRRG